MIFRYLQALSAPLHTGLEKKILHIPDHIRKLQPVIFTVVTVDTSVAHIPATTKTNPIVFTSCP